jgi:hypothetical protein
LSCARFPTTFPKTLLYFNFLRCWQHWTRLEFLTSLHYCNNRFEREITKLCVLGTRLGLLRRSTKHSHCQRVKLTITIWYHYTGSRAITWIHTKNVGTFCSHTFQAPLPPPAQYHVIRINQSQHSISMIHTHTHS